MWALLVPAASAATAQALVSVTWAVSPARGARGIELALQVAPDAGPVGLRPVGGAAFQILRGDGVTSSALTLRAGGAAGLFPNYDQAIWWAHTVGLAREIEVGVSFSPPGPALRFGGVATFADPFGGPFTHLGPRVDWRPGHPLDLAMHFGGGIQALSPSPLPAVAGRPLRVAGRVVLPRTIGRPGPAVDAARGEWASVPAFLHIAAELEALGARDLAARARAAAVEEVRHTLARLDAPALMEALPVPPVRAGNRDARLARIAWESLVDGVIGEGEAAERLEDEQIAEEERGHAALAADIVGWARGESAAARAVT